MPVAPTDITAVHRGLDAAAATAAFGNVPDHVMTDHFGHDVAAYENMTHLHSRCQQALKRAIWEEEHELPPYIQGFVAELCPCGCDCGCGCAAKLLKKIKATYP